MLAFHPQMEIHLFKEGRGAFLIEGRHYPFRKNTLLIIQPNDLHKFIPAPDRYIVMCTAFFRLDWLAAHDPRMTFPPGFPKIVSLSENEALCVDVLLRQMEAEIRRQEPFWADLVHESLKQVMLIAKRAGLRPAGIRKENPVACQLMAHLEEHYTGELDLAGLSRTFGYSEDYLSRLLKRHTGLGLKRYILQRRIVEAQKLLENEPKLTMAAVAERVGFTDFGIFNRNFKIIAGMTPASYRGISHLQVG